MVKGRIQPRKWWVALYEALEIHFLGVQSDFFWEVVAQIIIVPEQQEILVDFKTAEGFINERELKKNNNNKKKTNKKTDSYVSKIQTTISIIFRSWYDIRYWVITEALWVILWKPPWVHLLNGPHH